MWSKNTEIEFFRKYLERVEPEKLFYKIGNEYYAYYPKSYKEKKSVLQSRNAFIGEYTENFCKNLLNDFAKKHNLYVVNKVICNELGLTSKTPADLVLSTTPEKIQKPEDIKIIFEVKMSIVNNYKYYIETDKIEFIGDYTTHIGKPSLLRSDSVLKAIGKSINIRISHNHASKIPIIILGNTPIATSYMQKVDRLKEKGFIQGFWSLYPEASKYLEKTQKNGFLTIKSVNDLYSRLEFLLRADLQFVSFMLKKEQLGKFIEIASKENNLENKAEKFLQMITEV